MLWFKIPVLMATKTNGTGCERWLTSKICVYDMPGLAQISTLDISVVSRNQVSTRPTQSTATTPPSIHYLHPCIHKGPEPLPPHFGEALFTLDMLPVSQRDHTHCIDKHTTTGTLQSPVNLTCLCSW